MIKDRDVSEKIALGLPNPGGRDEQFDQRLFNQSRVSTCFNIPYKGIHICVIFNSGLSVA